MLIEFEFLDVYFVFGLKERRWEVEDNEFGHGKSGFYMKYIFNRSSRIVSNSSYNRFLFFIHELVQHNKSSNTFVKRHITQG